MTDQVTGSPGTGDFDDPALVAADAAIMDALAEGRVPDDADQVANLLAAWRSDLDADAGPTVVPAGTATDAPAGAIADPGSGATTAEPASAPVVPLRPRRRRYSRRLLAAAAAVVLGMAGLGIAAVNGTPGSPLWALTRVLNPDRVAVLDARDALDDARAALRAGQPAEAARDLDRARAAIARVHDADQARRLRAELDRLSAELAALRTGLGVVPRVTPSPSLPAVPGPPSAGPGGPGATSGPQPGTTGPLPPVPLPSLPVPVPSLPLPTTPSLPGLPLPTPTLPGG